LIEVRNGRFFFANASWFDNCNSCKVDSFFFMLEANNRLFRFYTNSSAWVGLSDAPRSGTAGSGFLGAGTGGDIFLPRFDL